MNCPQCGTPVQPGQRRCSCGQYLPRATHTDMPSDFYSRIENQVQRTGKDNFRRGLLMGLGFLALFLVLEAAIESSGAMLRLLIALTYVSVLGLTGTNIYLAVKANRRQPNSPKLTTTIVTLSILGGLALLILMTVIRIGDYYGPPIT